MPKKVHWQYYFARKFSLQRFEIVARTLTSDFYQEHFGVHIRNILIQPAAGGNHAIWLQPKEWNRAVNKIFRVVCRDLASFYRYKNIIKATQRSWITAARRSGQGVCPQISNAALAARFDRFIHHHQEHFNKPIWIPFPIESLLSQAAEAALVSALKRSGHMDEYNHWFQVVFSPEEPNAITRLQQQQLLLAIAVKRGKLSGTRRTAALRRLAGQFAFIPCYDVIDPPWDLAHFREEIERLLVKPLDRLVADHRDLCDRFPKRRQEFQIFLKKFRFRRRERELLTMAHELVFIKDERDDYRRLGCWYGRPLFTEIGRRLGLSTKEASYLTIDETKNFLHLGIRPPSTAQVRERVAGYLLLRKEGGPILAASGVSLRTILRRDVGKQSEKLPGNVTGIVGASGNAQGLVTIVRTKHDLRRVSDGAIMVAVTTNPDYVPAMQKCAAVVTDEGGLTSHAAILCRELNIPAVVGTKTATMTFKDVDRVEVDARRGVVRRL